MKTPLIIIALILAVAWLYAEIVRSRRYHRKGRSRHPDPNARRASDSDDEGKARRGNNDFIPTPK